MTASPGCPTGGCSWTGCAATSRRLRPVGTGGGSPCSCWTSTAFKEVNDTLGHHSGDQLLREIGERLVAVLPVGATVARLGGDEFGVVLTSERHEASARQAALALRRVLERPVDVDGMSLDAPASIGVALYPDSARDAESLLRQAEVAMYAAKGASTAVAVYSPELNRYNPRRLALVTQLRRAVDQGELVVHYQPKVALSDRELVGVEALVRWDHPELGLVYPDDFVPLAEHTGSIGPLTAAVLGLALRRCAGWLAEGRRIGVAVNLSARSLLDPELPGQVLALLAAAEVPAGLLTLEITETSVMSDPDRTLAMLQQLQRMGVRLSVDDFGTGYSSLAYLRRLPVHEVKIDKSFVMPMATDQGDAAVVRAIVDLGHHLALRVVAEGVEDEITRDALRAMGCDVAQGYLYSRPLGEDRLESWMAARTVHVSTPEDARRCRLVRVVG